MMRILKPMESDIWGCLTQDIILKVNIIFARILSAPTLACSTHRQTLWKCVTFCLSPVSNLHWLHNSLRIYWPMGSFRPEPVTSLTCLPNLLPTQLGFSSLAPFPKHSWCSLHCTSNSTCSSHGLELPFPLQANIIFPVRPFLVTLLKIFRTLYCPVLFCCSS